MALFLQSSLIFNSPFVLLELFSYYLYSLLYLLFFPFILYHYRSQVYLPLPLVPGVIVSVAVASPTLISNARVTPLPHAEQVREWLCGRGVSLSQQFFHRTVCHVQP